MSISTMKVGDRVKVTDDGIFAKADWYPKGRATGTVQKVFKNGKVAVAIDQLRQIHDSGDGLRTLHYPSRSLQVL